MPGNILTPIPDDQLGRLALIEAMRANTDALQRVGRQVEGQERKFDEVNKTLGVMQTDIALLKNNALKESVDQQRAEIEKIKSRLDRHDEAEARRKGERGVWAAIGNSKVVVWLLGIAGTVGGILYGTSQGGGQ